jgi:hypothetical protein
MVGNQRCCCSVLDRWCFSLETDVNLKKIFVKKKIVCDLEMEKAAIQ